LPIQTQQSALAYILIMTYSTNDSIFVISGSYANQQATFIEYRGKLSAKIKLNNTGDSATIRLKSFIHSSKKNSQSHHIETTKLQNFETEDKFYSCKESFSENFDHEDKFYPCKESFSTNEDFQTEQKLMKKFDHIKEKHSSLFLDILILEQFIYNVFKVKL